MSNQKAKRREKEIFDRKRVENRRYNKNKLRKFCELFSCVLILVFILFNTVQLYIVDGGRHIEFRLFILNKFKSMPAKHLVMYLNLIPARLLSP